MPNIAADRLFDPLQKLEIPDSLRFVMLFTPHLRDGSVLLHKWQMEINEDISLGRVRDSDGVIIDNYTPTSLRPYKFCLCAANGSGKDAFLVAPLALWFICTKIKSKVIITSSSGNQLTTQTEHYISDLARAVNAWAKEKFGRDILKVNQRFIHCLLTDSVIRLFATDEPSRAEGHHPTVPGAEMLIILNEVKSLDPLITEAIKRCNGYTHWLNVSSPGEPTGFFHYTFQNWVNRRRITYFDCPHLWAQGEFEEDRKMEGEHSPYFRSKWLALFTYASGQYVVPKQQLDQLMQVRDSIPLLLQDMEIRIGIDIALSTHGDNTVVSVWKGNNQVALHRFRIKDATLLAPALELCLLQYVQMKHIHIFADDGGVGRAVIDIMNRKGWRINRVLNQSPALDKTRYKNRGAQSWNKFAKLIEQKAIILLPDKTQLEQICSRKYKERNGGNDLLTLESKKDMIAGGMKSPDEADASVLAFSDCSLKQFLDAIEGITVVKADIDMEGFVTGAEIGNVFRRGGPMDKYKAKSHGSLRALMYNN